MAEWQTRLAESLTRGDTAALPEMLILLGALIGCSSFALIQFFTMLGTRWGDKNPAPKSFVLSILVHVVVMLAWSTVNAIRPAPALMALPGDAGESIPIRELVDNEPEDNFDTGDTPDWQKLEDLPEPNLTRQERPLDEPLEMTDAPRTPVESPTPDVDPTELANLSVQPTTAVSPNQLSPQQMLVKPIPVPATPAETEPTTEAREEAAAGSPVRRQQRETDPLNVSEELPRTRGSADPAAENRADDLGMSIPLDPAGEQDENPVLAGRKADTIRQGAAPTPSSAPEADFTPGGKTNENGKPSSSPAKKFSRATARRTTEGTSDEPLLNRIPGEGRPVPNSNPERMLNPSRNSIEGLPGERPTPKLSPGGGPNLPNRSPATYKLRQLEKRRGTALKHGGSLESERAVENSLKWLAKVQERDGSWDADKHDGGLQQKDPHGQLRKGGGKLADCGVTGLALLAFMGAGYTPTDGEYSDNVDRALKWLIQQQRNDGYLGGNAIHYDQMYCHAIATFALGEACGMQEESERPAELRRAVRLAVEFIVERQGSDGGWRYDKFQEGDMSMFGWQLMALKSADIAGIKVKPEVWTGMIAFLKKRSQGENDGLAAYNLSPNTSKPTPAMTAEALFCKQMIGIRRTNPACQEAVGYLLKHLPQISRYDEYYWYYGTMAMFQQGGDAWDEWNNAMRDLLIQLQETRGKNAGSWDPKGKWAGIGGRVYSTALATLCLEVYYRYLPLYQTNQE